MPNDNRQPDTTGHLAPPPVTATIVEVLETHADELCDRWSDALLHLPKTVCQGQSHAEVLSSTRRVFHAFLNSLRDANTTDFHQAVVATARKRFENGCHLAALLESVGVARLTFLPILAESLRDRPDLQTESLAALMSAEERTVVWIAEAYEAVAETALQIAQEERARAEYDKVTFGRDIARLVTKERLVLCDALDVPERTDAPILPVVRPHNVREARHIVRTHAEALGWPPNRIYELQLCVGEAGTNAIRHAGTATFQAWTEGDAVTFRFADTGPGIDFNRIPSAISSGYSTGSSLGMGFTLMLELADTIRLATDNRGTVLQLTLGRRG